MMPWCMLMLIFFLFYSIAGAHLTFPDLNLPFLPFLTRSFVVGKKESPRFISGAF